MDLRLCIDPKDLKKCMKREHYRLAMKSDITGTMAGVFLANWMHRGDFTRLPWMRRAQNCAHSTRHLGGTVSSASEYARRQKYSEELYSSCSTESREWESLDDIIWGKTQDKHDERLRKVLQTTCVSGLRLKKLKCQFGVSELTYLGDELSTAGVQPDPDKDSRGDASADKPDRAAPHAGLGQHTQRHMSTPQLPAAKGTTHGTVSPVGRGTRWEQM